MPFIRNVERGTWANYGKRRDSKPAVGARLSEKILTIENHDHHEQRAKPQPLNHPDNNAECIRFGFPEARDSCNMIRRGYISGAQLRT
jgi:hypothetical protein